ncbi:MAG: hypothetical protein ACTS2F_30410 [Thainema sp.]
MLADKTKAINQSKGSIQKENKAPAYVQNYNRGYIGFTYSDSNLVSLGIAYFTGLGRMSDIITTHTLLVTGPDRCIEAHAKGGVQCSTLSQYFDDPTTDIFFRKPRNLDEEIATRIIARAEQEMNRPYDLSLISAHMLSGTMMGYYLNKISKGKLEQVIAKMMNVDEKWICSELIAYCLDQPPYLDKGILKQPCETISPQELFEDPLGDLFEPWHNFRLAN